MCTSLDAFGLWARWDSSLSVLCCHLKSAGGCRLQLVASALLWQRWPGLQPFLGFCVPHYNSSVVWQHGTLCHVRKDSKPPSACIYIENPPCRKCCSAIAPAGILSLQYHCSCPKENHIGPAMSFPIPRLLLCIRVLSVSSAVSLYIWSSRTKSSKPLNPHPRLS